MPINILQICHFAVGAYAIMTGDIAVCKLFAVCLYFYGGLQKLNYRFVNTDAVPYFLSDFCSKLKLNTRRISTELSVVMSVSSAIVEILISLGLLFESTQYIAVLVGLMIHVIILLAVGPLGSNDYHGIWAWNVYCMATLWILFIQIPVTDSLWYEINSLLAVGSIPIWISFIFFALCPLLSWFELWHPQLSFQMHSSNFPEIRLRFSAPKLLDGHDISKWIDRAGFIDIFGIAGTHGVCPAFSFRVGVEWAKYLAKESGQCIFLTYKSRPGLFTGVRAVSSYIVTTDEVMNITDYTD